MHTHSTHTHTGPRETHTLHTRTHRSKRNTPMATCTHTPHIHTQVQEKHSNGQRLRLNLTLKAPEIIVPLHSSSDEVIIADLGVLQLSNSFHIVDSWSGDERPPLYEEYDIQLKDLRVFRYYIIMLNYDSLITSNKCGFFSTYVRTSR